MPKSHKFRFLNYKNILSHTVAACLLTVLSAAKQTWSVLQHPTKKNYFCTVNEAQEKKENYQGQCVLRMNPQLPGWDWYWTPYIQN